MTLVNDAPLPLKDAVVDNQGRMVTTWINWFTSQLQRISQGPQRAGSVSLTGQSASLSATDFSGGIPTGEFAIRWYARITTPAGVNSSLTATFAWTDRGVSQTGSGTAITGNTTTTYQSGSIPLIYCDGSTPVTYALTYASNPAGQMVYQFFCTLERIV